MNPKTLLLYLLIPATCLKSNFVENRNANKLTPKGWKVIGSCSADFNNDKIIDKAYVIQEEKETIVSDNEECLKGEKYHRKELIIEFGIGNCKYILNLKTSKIFGTCNWGIQGTEAFSAISKRKNTLKLTFFTGGTLRSNLSYYFRYQNNNWFLIGYDELTYQVPYQDEYIKKINYLTGKKETYEIINGKSSRHEFSDIGKKELSKLDDLDAVKDNTFGQE